MSDMKPLVGLSVLDLGVGMPSALVTKFLQEFGARVMRVEADGGDPFYEIYPAYRSWHSGSKILSATECPSSRFDEMLSVADICVVGGESHPDLEWRHDGASMAEKYPRLVVLSISGYPVTHPERAKPAVDLLVQARAGLTFAHYSHRPIMFGYQPTLYGAALHGIIGLLAALYEREQHGHGQLVATSLFQGALNWLGTTLAKAEHPNKAFDLVQPMDPRPMIVRCADNQFIHIAMGTPGAKYRLYKILGINDPTVAENDAGLPNVDGPAEQFFGDIDRVAKFVELCDSRSLLERLWHEGLAADRVLPPGACWDHPQIQHNAIICVERDGGRHVGNPIAAASSLVATRVPPAPIDRLKALDFGSFMAGPHATAVLNDMGIDTIKVEPLRGDPNRGMLRCFNSSNRGKRSIAVDLKTSEGRDIATRLCLAADIVTSNFRPGVADRLGIGAARLHALKPELIVLDNTGYGTDGPSAEKAAFDALFQALCGHEHRAGGFQNSPLWNRMVPVDYTGALLGAVAIMAGLVHRARSGNGSTIGVPLINAGAYLLSELVQAPDGAFSGADQLDRERAGIHPAERIYQVADGWIAIAARGNAAASRLAKALNLTRLIDRPRADWSDADTAEIAAALRVIPIARAMDMLSSFQVWAERCLQEKEARILEDSNLAAIGAVYSSQDACLGITEQIGPLFTPSLTAAYGRGPAPQLGQHTQQILSALGYEDSEISSLLARGIIR
jgi:crotonobetainyl-CoA:carnitine CoA-transferase CaiB-like acyl-CoA transferase